MHAVRRVTDQKACQDEFLDRIQPRWRSDCVPSDRLRRPKIGGHHTNFLEVCSRGEIWRKWGELSGIIGDTILIWSAGCPDSSARRGSGGVTLHHSRCLVLRSIRAWCHADDGRWILPNRPPRPSSRASPKNKIGENRGTPYLFHATQDVSRICHPYDIQFLCAHRTTRFIGVNNNDDDERCRVSRVRTTPAGLGPRVEDRLYLTFRDRCAILNNRGRVLATLPGGMGPDVHRDLPVHGAPNHTGKLCLPMAPS